MGTLSYREVKIASGQTASNEIDLLEHQLVGIQIGTITGATFSFLGRVSDKPINGTTPSAVAVVDNAGNAVSVTATDDRFIVFDEEPLKNLSGVRFLTFVSAGAEADDRTFWVALRRTL